MGNHLSHASLKVDEPISVGKGFAFYDAPENKPTVLICAMDYPQLPSHLTYTYNCHYYNSRNMEELCQNCGIIHTYVMTDEHEPLAKEMVTGAIENLLSHMRSGDTFVFYYSGHGTYLKDGEDVDEAYCFQNESGQIDQYSCMTDDQFASIMTEHTPRGVNVIVLSDCCHSGTICDFSKSSWREIKAASISGCEDRQTTGNVYSTNGFFTHAMLNAIEQLQACQDDGRLDAGAYSVGLLYNVTLWSKEDRFSGQSQKICIENTPDMCLYNAVWPLIPVYPYIAPINKRSLGREFVHPVQRNIKQLTRDSSDTDGSGMLASIGKQ